MSRPEKFSTASAEECRRAWMEDEHDSWESPFEYVVRVIIPEVAREVREECAAELESLRADNLRLLMERVSIIDRAERAERERDDHAQAARNANDWATQAEAEMKQAKAHTADAKREGAWEALTKLARSWDYGLSRVPPEIARDVAALERFRDTHYAPPAPAGVTLGEWRVTYIGGTNPYRVAKGRQVTEFADVVGMCYAMGWIPTQDEYAALLRLADREGKV